MQTFFSMCGAVSLMALLSCCGCSWLRKRSKSTLDSSFVSTVTSGYRNCPSQQATCWCGTDADRRETFINVRQSVGISVIDATIYGYDTALSLSLSLSLSLLSAHPHPLGLVCLPLSLSVSFPGSYSLTLRCGNRGMSGFKHCHIMCVNLPRRMMLFVVALGSKCEPCRV